MTDVLSKEQRRKNMQAIRAKETALEKMVRKELWKNGIRYRKNVRGLMGAPDIAIKKYKLVIFLDSCYWHGCPEHGVMPKSNREFWEKKIKRNIERDIEVTNYYKSRNWTILRFWEHEAKQDLDRVINRIITAINDFQSI
jgi:DNA mismatch endonuclease (patch repair protein)